jgi:uncharacterized protein YdeI (YjbR/CyaY-like superfamily)
VSARPTHPSYPASPVGAADDGLPKILFSSPAEWEEWLENNHAASEGVWIKIAKKYAGIDSVRYPEVLESALCFGWIDGRREKLDERYFLQRFTPRRSRNSQNRYAILYRLQDAKKPETRARRLATFVAMLEAGETIHP